MADVRFLSPAGIERVANGWDRSLASGGEAAFEAAEKSAIHAIELANRGDAWDELRRSLFGLTESGAALQSWRAEHGPVGHKAERAVFGAALGLLTADLLDAAQVRVLLLPMAESLPWLAEAD